MVREVLAAVTASIVVVCGTGYAVAKPKTLAKNQQSISRSNDGACAQASANGYSVGACNTGHSGDVAADHALRGEDGVERTVVNGSRGGCVWSVGYSKKIYRYGSVTMRPGPDGNGLWVTAK